MIKRLALLLVLFAALAATSAARSQQPTGKTSGSGKTRVQVDDSVNLAPSPELQKSLEDLAASMQALAHRIANDPQLRSDAMRVASGLVNTAQHVVAEQSVVLQGALKTASERIAAEQSAQISTPKNHR
jgi:hypothetical protein